MGIGASIELIPAIDIIDGKVVRLAQGQYDRMVVYHAYPLEMAKEFEQAGIDRLHVVDLDGAREAAVKNWKVLELIAGKTSLKVDFGGGVKTEKDVEVCLNSGAKWISIGSVAVKKEEEFARWLSRFGADLFLLGADVKGDEVMISGWLEKGGIQWKDFLKKWTEGGIQQCFMTDIAKDGMLQGPSMELYQMVLELFPNLKLIASGGVSSMKDVYRLQEIGCSGVIMGKAIYEGLITLKDLEEFKKKQR